MQSASIESQTQSPTSARRTDDSMPVAQTLLDLCLKGRSATEAELASARTALLRDPGATKARALLLGAAHASERHQHVLWFIEHHPETWLLSFSVIPANEPAHPRGAELWARAVAASSGDRRVTVVANAARYHFFTEPEKAEAIMLSLRESTDSADSRAAIADFYGEWQVFLSASNRESEARAIGARALEQRAASFALQPLARRLPELAAVREHARYAVNQDFGRLQGLAAEETRVALSIGDRALQGCYLHSAAGLLFLGVSSMQGAVDELAALPVLDGVTAVRLPHEMLRAGMIEEVRTFVRRCEQAKVSAESLVRAIDQQGRGGE